MWNLYQNDKFLEPLVFSNGKSQEDIVKEVLREIKKGNKIIFIHGVCGTGKSAIALNLAKKLGQTSIIVPIKNLQEQYKKDYEKKKYVLKNKTEKLKISVITGRNNHKCKFLEEQKESIPKREVNTKLHDIFSGKREEAENIKDASADNQTIPCKISIKESNWNKIKSYLMKNSDVNVKNFSQLNDVKRVSIAGACPYWSPSIPSKYELGGTSFVNAIQKEYTGLNNTKFTIYSRRPGCKFYEQFLYYINSDVIVFNSLKYQVESWLKRKPATEAEIIDECDEFLDSLSNQKTLNLDRLQNTLIKTIATSEDSLETLQTLSSQIKQVKRDREISHFADTEKIFPLKETKIYEVIKTSINNPDFFYDQDEESYLFELYEAALRFADFIEETYVIFSKKEDQLQVSLVTTNLEKRFKELANQNKIIILMSGTLHSNEVLKDIFGLKNYKIIGAESQNQGQIKVKRLGCEFDCKYSNFASKKHSRGRYLLNLSKCIEEAEKPTLVQVNAFSDLPSKKELKEFKITNLISREELIELQKEDKNGEIIERFKNKEIEVLFSTRASRGIDFPGNQCNSIVFTKYPNPNVKDAFWRILQRTQPDKYWEFYKDKAQRDLWQKVYRGLRSKNDKVEVLSPDCRVLDFFDQQKSLKPDN